MIFLRVLLAGIASIAAVLLLDRWLAAREPAVVQCDGGAEESVYGEIIHEARRQVWVSDVEARLKGTDE